MNQTERYIVLKPIAERFARVANEITDEEIKSLIKYEMRLQIEKIDFVRTVRDVIDDYLDRDTTKEEIIGLLKANIKNKFR